MNVASGTRPAHAAAAKKPQRHPDMIVRKPAPSAIRRKTRRLRHKQGEGLSLALSSLRNRMRAQRSIQTFAL